VSQDIIAPNRHFHPSFNTWLALATMASVKNQFGVAMFLRDVATGVVE
jgi:hypothetical protein